MLVLTALVAAFTCMEAHSLKLPALIHNGKLNHTSLRDSIYSASALARFRAVSGSNISEKRTKILKTAFVQRTSLIVSEEVQKAQRTLEERMKDVIFDKPTVEEINAPIAAFLQGGDIMPAPVGDFSSNDTETRHKRGAPVMTSWRWPKNQPIAFAFNGDIVEADRRIIRAVTAQIADNTCLSFRENSNVGTQLVFQRGGGCWSYIGVAMQGKQPISIDNGCNYHGIIAHELAHALGLDHTQNRKDRDNYINLNLNSVNSDQQHNFVKRTDRDNDNFGVPYEYGSDMHYGANDFSNNGRPVIIPKDVDYANTIGQNKRLTFNDYKMINLMYKCSENCPRQMVCYNGGYPSPKNCNACVCPDFFSGESCEIIDAAIGLSETNATATTFVTPYDAQAYNSGNAYNWEMFRKYSVLVRAPVGRRIRVTVTKMHHGEGWSPMGCYAGCPFVGLEFVDGDPTAMGKLFCCTKDQGYSFISKTNVVAQKAYSSPGWPLEAVATYSIV